MSGRARKHVDTINQTVNVLESVDKELVSIFADDAGPNSFFGIRAEYLHLFQSLAVNLYQHNTLKYLITGKLSKGIFAKEYLGAKAKVMELKMRIIDTMHEKLEKYTEQLERLLFYDNNLVSILNSFDSKTNSSFHLRIFIKNDSVRKQSLIYAIDDTRSKILIPMIEVVRNEIEAGQKVLEVLFVENRTRDNDKYNLDELARICELISMGFDSPSQWDDIKKIVQNNEIHREITNLKPHSNLESETKDYHNRSN